MPYWNRFFIHLLKGVSRVLANVKKRYLLDNIQKQQLTREVSALYGSLAFMYAKHISMGLKDSTTLTPAYQEQVDAIYAYVEEMGYQDILQ